jgi:hypothetical protein
MGMLDYMKSLKNNTLSEYVNNPAQAKPSAGKSAEPSTPTLSNLVANPVVPDAPKVVSTPTNTIASTIANGNGNTTPTASTSNNSNPAPIVTKEPLKAVDNTDMINSSYNSIAEALRAKIQQSMNDKNVQISKLPEKYQPDRDTSAVATDQQIRTLNEQAANAGDRGGIGRQNTLSAMVGGENRINTITMAQKAEEAQLRNDIANLTLEGNIQEAQNQAARLKDLIANNTAMNNTNYERSFNAETMANNQANSLRAFDENVRQYNDTSATNRATADRNYKLGLANDMGKTFDTDGNLVDSAVTIRQRELDAQTKADKEKKDYLDSIKGLGDQFDYAGAIDSIVKDGDTSNDWKIPFLKQEREAKVQAKLQNDIATIGQYSKDYQAEIDKRQPNDPLLPYLKTAQLQKIAAMNTAATSAKEAQQKQAMDIWVKMGVATPEVAAVLGIPAGAQTSDYGVDLANINQSNASASASLANAATNSGQLEWAKSTQNPDNISKLASVNGTKLSESDQKNLGIAKLTSILDAIPPKEQDAYLKKNKENIIKDYGLATYKSLSGE